MSSDGMPGFIDRLTFKPPESSLPYSIICSANNCCHVILQQAARSSAPPTSPSSIARWHACTLSRRKTGKRPEGFKDMWRFLYQMWKTAERRDDSADSLVTSEMNEVLRWVSRGEGLTGFCDWFLEPYTAAPNEESESCLFLCSVLLHHDSNNRIIKNQDENRQRYWLFVFFIFLSECKFLEESEEKNKFLLTENVLILMEAT